MIHLTNIKEQIEKLEQELQTMPSWRDVEDMDDSFIQQDKEFRQY
jgi:hypothetical protein